MRLLFVEDNPDDLELICAELQRFGFAFEHGRVDSLDALRLALEFESWSAVLSDYNLPGFTGIDALHVVREYAHDLPFLLVSNHLGEELAVDAIRAGVNDYVMKDRLGRLGPAVERELRDVQLREERRALFNAYRRSEDRYRRIFEKAPVGVAVTTPTGDILNVNERLASTLGHARQELVGRPIHAFVHPDDARATFAAEQRYVRKDGQVVWTRVTIASVNADDLTVEQLVWLIEDVTEQRQHELELRSQREQLDEAQRLARLGSYELDLLTRRCTWSTELCHIYGIEPGPAPDLELAEMRIHPDDREWVIARRKQIVDAQQPFELEHRLLLPNGEVRLLSGRGRFLFDDDGRAVKVLGVVHDVTEARAQEDELQRRAMQQVVVANLGQAALAGEPTDALLGQAAEIVTRLLDVEICHILEATPTGRFRIVGGSGWNDDVVIGTDVPSAALATYTIESGAPVIVDDLRIETRFVPSAFLLRQEVVSGMAVPISTGRGAPWGVLGAHTRVLRTFSSIEVDFLRSVATVLAQAFERDRVDQQLVLHAAQQTAIAELSQIALRSVDDAVAVVCDLVRNVLEVRNAEFIRGEDAVCDGQLTVSVASANARFGVLSADGKHGEIHDGDREFLQSLANILADAMERERSAAAARRAELRLEQAERLTSLGRLAATIAHEFNNVLMGISPFVEVLRRGRNVESSLDHIGRAVKRGKRITQDILRFTQPAQPVRAAFDVASWIENITIEARTLLPTQYAIETAVAAGLHLDGDANQLQQIFTNLILNARDAMIHGGTLTIEVVRENADARLPFAVERPERFAHFVVRDTGCGMSDETLRHIFEPLFTTKKNGTGLGLPVTHQVVQRHGGEIFVASTPDVGTAFHIFLPLSEETEVRVAEPAPAEASPATSQRVLLVEDDRSVATGIAALLELEGLHVDVAENGAAAIDAVNAAAPDVVVLDVGLPDMEGTSVYSAIAARRPDLPIIFSTGHGDRAKLDDLLERPHIAYLLKPYESSALLGAIRDVTQA